MNNYAREVKKMNKQILLFGVSEKQQEHIKAFCSSLNIEVKAVERKNYSEPISVIVGFPKSKSGLTRRSQGKVHNGDGETVKPYRMTGFPEPMMVFCNLEQEDLDNYLAGYAAAGIEKIALKAVLTPHNISWTPEQLFEELSNEHKAMTQKK